MVRTGGVVYEAVTQSSSSLSSSLSSTTTLDTPRDAIVFVSRLGARLLTELVVAGPRQLLAWSWEQLLQQRLQLQQQQQHPSHRCYYYARGSNEPILTTYATVSLAAWLLCGCWAWWAQPAGARSDGGTNRFTSVLFRTATTSSTTTSSTTRQEKSWIRSVLVKWMLLRRQKQHHPPEDEEEQEEKNDGTEIQSSTHRGSCQCGAVQFQIRAPRTLYVQQPQQDNSSSSNDNSNDSKIQYPRIAVPVDAFVLRRGRHQLQTFLPPQPQQAQPSPSDVVVVVAHTFCRVCGVHLVQAVDPSAKELYVNALCLVGTKSEAQPVVAAQRSSYKQEQQQDQQQQPIQSSQCVDFNSATNKHATSSSRNINNISSSIGASPPSPNNDCSSDSDPEMVILSEQDPWDDHRDPEFTLTAAEDSRSTSTSSASYCDDEKTTSQQQQPRQHRARAPETTGTAVDTTGTVCGGNNDGNLRTDEPTMAAVDLNTSFGSSSSSSTTDAQQEQLRKFLGKHVAHQ